MKKGNIFEKTKRSLYTRTSCTCDQRSNLRNAIPIQLRVMSTTIVCYKYKKL